MAVNDDDFTAAEDFEKQIDQVTRSDTNEHNDDSSSFDHDYDDEYCRAPTFESADKVLIKARVQYGSN